MNSIVFQILVLSSYLLVFLTICFEIIRTNSERVGKLRKRDRRYRTVMISLALLALLANSIPESLRLYYIITSGQHFVNTTLKGMLAYQISSVATNVTLQSTLFLSLHLTLARYRAYFESTNKSSPWFLFNTIRFVDILFILAGIVVDCIYRFVYKSNDAQFSLLYTCILAPAAIIFLVTDLSANSILVVSITRNKKFKEKNSQRNKVIKRIHALLGIILVIDVCSVMDFLLTENISFTTPLMCVHICLSVRLLDFICDALNSIL